MHSRSDNIELMIKDKEDKVMEKLQSLLSRYQIGLETLMKDSDFIFDCVNLLQYKCHRINFKCDRWHVDSPDRIKNKKATMNPIN